MDRVLQIFDECDFGDSGDEITILARNQLTRASSGDLIHEKPSQNIPRDRDRITNGIA